MVAQKQVALCPGVYVVWSQPENSFLAKWVFEGTHRWLISNRELDGNGSTQLTCGVIEGETRGMKGGKKEEATKQQRPAWDLGLHTGTGDVLCTSQCKSTVLYGKTALTRSRPSLLLWVTTHKPFLGTQSKCCHSEVQHLSCDPVRYHPTTSETDTCRGVWDKIQVSLPLKPKAVMAPEEGQD